MKTQNKIHIVLKNAVLFICIVFPFFGYAQNNYILHSMLWDYVKPCYMQFEDIDDDGEPEYKKIEDAKNGYLHISGGWPACGCGCSSTVAAFKNSNGEYCFLMQEEEYCEWKKRISSNYSLSKIFPENFAVEFFQQNTDFQTLSSPAFYIDFKIPQYGTETTAHIEIIPFGIPVKSTDFYCYGYSENADCTPIGSIQHIVRKSIDYSTIDYIIQGEFNKISQVDSVLVSKYVGELYGQFKTLQDLQQTLIHLNNIYNVYNQLEYRDIILQWNKENSKFEIKSKINKPTKLNFKEFLLVHNYWGITC